MEFLTLENFLWLQVVLVVVGVLYILRRGKRVGATFRFRARAERIPPNEMTRAPQMWNADAPLAKPRIVQDDGRVLNIHFNYNGHSFDAFEVLGIPAGCGLDRVEAAYQAAVRSGDPRSRELYDLAYQAIRGQR